MLNEHKQSQPEAMTKYFRKYGYDVQFGPCETGPMGGGSAGVAIVARQHLLVKPCCAEDGEEISEARFAAATLAVRGGNFLIALQGPT